MDNKRHGKNGRRKMPAYTPQGDPQALSTPVEELGLHERTLNALKAGGVNTAADLAGRFMRDMYKVQGIGKRDIFAMQGALKKLGLAFRPEEGNFERKAPVREGAQGSGVRGEKKEFRQDKGRGQIKKEEAFPRKGPKKPSRAKRAALSGKTGAGTEKIPKTRQKSRPLKAEKRARKHSIKSFPVCMPGLR